MRINIQRCTATVIAAIGIAGLPATAMADAGQRFIDQVLVPAAATSSGPVTTGTASDAATPFVNRVLSGQSPASPATTVGSTEGDGSDSSARFVDQVLIRSRRS